MTNLYEHGEQEKSSRHNLAAWYLLGHLVDYYIYLSPRLTDSLRYVNTPKTTYRGKLGKAEEMQPDGDERVVWAAADRCCRRKR